MSQPVRKVALTIHVAASVGWVGALAVFLAHALVSWTAEDVQVVRAAALAMATSAWFVILPMALGLVKPAGLTRWGRAAQNPPPAAARSTPGLPLWVKVSAAAVGGLLLLVALMVLGGNHGPTAHMP